VWTGVVMAAVVVWVAFAGVVLDQVSPTLSEPETAMLALFSAVFGVWVVVWLVLAWRFSGIGVYVSADGIQVRKWLKTTTISWSEVERIGSAPASRLTVPATNLAIWIFPCHGPKIETMLTDQPHGVLRGVEGFQRTLDSLRKAHAASAVPQGM
jgi:hypothetical protein